MITTKHTSLLKFTLACILLLLCTSGRAQNNELVYPGFPQYENFNSFHLAPGGQGFATGECDLFIRTKDDGRNWEALEFPVPRSRPQAVSCIPATNCETVIATTSRGIHFSTDGGDSWTNTTTTAAAPRRFSYAIDGHIFGYSPGQTAFSFSTDNGQNWQELSLPAQLSDEFIPISATEWVFFGKDEKMYRTENSGANWSVVSELPGPPVLVERDTAGDFYLEISDNNSFYKSTDNGRSWTLKTTNAHQYTSYFDLWKDAEDSLHVISFNGSRFSSADDGATWTTRVVSPRFQTYTAFVRQEGRLFACGRGLTLVVSNEDWTEARFLLKEEINNFVDISFSDPVLGYALTRQGLLYKTRNGGDSWSLKTDLGRTTGPHMKVLHGDIYAFAGDFTLVRSTNGGTAFSEPTFLRQANMDNDRIVFDSLPNGGLIAVTAQKTVRVNADGSIAATYTNGVPINGATWDMRMINDQLGFVIRSGREPFYRTEDGGRNWTEMPSPGRFNFFTYVTFINDNTGFTGNGSSTYRTEDAGKTWVEDGVLPGSSQLFQRGEDLYGVNSNSLFRSRDLGLSWEVMDWVACRGISNATLHPSRNTIYTLYSGAIGRFNLDDILIPVRESKLESLALGVSPNPTSGQFRLNLPAGNWLGADVRVHDLAGRKILNTRLNNTQNPTLDLGRYPAGIYLVQVRNGTELRTARVVKR